MTVSHEQFLLYCGDTWQFDATLHDCEGAPLNLDNAKVEWFMRTLVAANGQGRIVASASSESGHGIEVTNPAAGECTITIAATTTATIPENAYNDQTRVTLSDGFVTTQAVGIIVAAYPGSPRIGLPDYGNACLTVLKLRAAQLNILHGERQQSVQIENFKVEYSIGNMNDLEAAIQKYEGLCAKQNGGVSRRYAMRARAGSYRY